MKIQNHPKRTKTKHADPKQNQRIGSSEEFQPRSNTHTDTDTDTNTDTHAPNQTKPNPKHATDTSPPTNTRMNNDTHMILFHYHNQHSPHHGRHNPASHTSQKHGVWATPSTRGRGASRSNCAMRLFAITNSERKSWI